MPIYEYRCAACGHRLEAMQKISDAALTDCPSCRQPELKRLISAASFQLKGSGWYATDFKGDGKGEKGKKSDSSESDAGNKTHRCGGGPCGCAH